jgi:hypothetical protein
MTTQATVTTSKNLEIRPICKVTTPTLGIVGAKAVTDPETLPTFMEMLLTVIAGTRQSHPMEAMGQILRDIAFTNLAKLTPGEHRHVWKPIEDVTSHSFFFFCITCPCPRPRCKRDF